MAYVANASPDGAQPSQNHTQCFRVARQQAFDILKQKRPRLLGGNSFHDAKQKLPPTLAVLQTLSSTHRRKRLARKSGNVQVMVGKGCRSSLAKILVDQSWLGCFPMALPDQLATLAVLLADKRHLEVPAESDRVQGVGHELHPRAFRSHPEMTGHRRNTLRCAEHFLPGVSSSQQQATKIWRRTKSSYEHIMIVQVLRGKTNVVCVLRLHFCMAFVVVRAVRTHAPRA